MTSRSFLINMNQATTPINLVDLAPVLIAGGILFCLFLGLILYVLSKFTGRQNNG